MTRPERWWRPSTVRRPAQRARARRTYSDKELDTTFDTGYATGYADAVQWSANRDRQIRRLVEAIEASDQGDPEPLKELGRQAAADDLLDVADAAGVTPTRSDVTDDISASLVDEVERWLREQD